MLISRHAKEIFAHAHALDPDTRAEYITKTCGSDQQLHDEVSSLLVAANDSEDYFDRLTGHVGLAALADGEDSLPENRVVGRWRLKRLIGRGGMGAVYLAERADGQFEKRAALKILPMGMNDDESRARFLTERQILARLVHDNIARLLDGGVTEDGTPFFVMDYVEGMPIDQYCAQHKLTIEQRLGLVLDVARGVQFAHRNLVIHRDLKPGNVLVEEGGRARLLDFGIAKVLEPTTDQAGLTQISQRPVTPRFASPEMLSGDAVDVTTDVYSVGVIMYLLLAGRLPLDYDGLTLAEMHVHAATTVPPPVSQFNSAVDEDIDAIVGKALAKLPTERYQSVDSLANDIRNQMNGLPVTAKVPSAWYRARKFVSRHRAGALFAGSAVLALFAFALLATYSAVTTERQSRTIALERDRAEETKNFLISIFDSADPTRAAADMTAREILDAGRERIGVELSDQPQVRADLLATIGDVYQVMGLTSEWRQALESERRLRADLSGTESSEYAKVLLRLSEAEDLDGRYELSREHAMEGLALSQRLGDPLGEAAGQVRVGRILHLQGNFEGADSGYRKALAIYRDEFGDDSLEVAAVNAHRATLLMHRGQYEDALPLLENVLAIRRKFHPGDNAENPGVLLALGATLNKLKRSDEAIAVYERTLAMNDRLFGPDNSYNLYIFNGLGKVATDLGDFDAAITRYEEAIRLLILHTPESPNLGRAKANLGKVHMLDGRYDLALPVYREALAILQSSIPDHWFLGEVEWRLGRCLAEAGAYAEAESFILAGIDTIAEQWGKDHEATQEAYVAAVQLYTAWGKPMVAETYQRFAVPVPPAQRPADPIQSRADDTG